MLLVPSVSLVTAPLTTFHAAWLPCKHVIGYAGLLVDLPHLSAGMLRKLSLKRLNAFTLSPLSSSACRYMAWLTDQLGTT